MENFERTYIFQVKILPNTNTTQNLEDVTQEFFKDFFYLTQTQHILPVKKKMQSDLAKPKHPTIHQIHCPIFWSLYFLSFIFFFATFFFRSVCSYHLVLVRVSQLRGEVEPQPFVRFFTITPAVSQFAWSVIKPETERENSFLGSNIFDFHPYLGKWSKLICFNRVETTN